MQRTMMEWVLELEARRHQSLRSFKRHHGRGKETKEGNLAGQMERLPNPLDSSHVSLWKGAHRKSLEEREAKPQSECLIRFLTAGFAR